MTYIIAEVGGNHDGSYDLAKELIKSAAECGADAVKFQIYDAEKLVHPSAEALPQAKGYDKQLTRFKSLQFNTEQWHRLRHFAKECEIDFLATFFDVKTFDQWAPFLKMVKISSGDATWEPMLRAAAMSGKPVLLSTGMCNYMEIHNATRFIPPEQLTVMHCVTEYPTPPEDANLGVIPVLMDSYRVGYSDHTIGLDACYIAVSMGCEVIEKHFTHDKTLDYGDHPHSMNAEDLRSLVEFCRLKELMCGVSKPTQIEIKQRLKFRRGTYAAHDLEAGVRLQVDDIIALRPYNHNPDTMVGYKTTRAYKELEPIGTD